jgi:RecA/RadA recombinase
MGKLTSQLNDILKSNNVGEEFDAPVLRCGIDVLDYRNGKKGFKNGNPSYIIGFDSGKIIGLIGKSGVAKSTLAVQMMGNMQKKFEDAVIFHYDFERSTNSERIMSLLRADESIFEEKYKKLSQNIFQESVHDLIMKIRETKIGKPGGAKTKSAGQYDPKVAEEFIVENPFKKGEMILTPTFILIDSLATMMPRDIIIDEEQGSNMQAAQVAKTNANFFRKVIGDLGDTATTLFIVNHLTKKISINPRQPVSADINYLDADENMPGGTAVRYLMNTLIKLIARKKLGEEDEFGINGFIVEAKFVKCRSNRAGVSCNLVYNQNKGFSNVLTNYLLIKEAGVIGGGGRGFFLKNLPDVKFKQKDIEDLYENSKEFRTAFKELVKPILESFIPEMVSDDEEEEAPKKSKKSKKSRDDDDDEEEAPKKSKKSKKSRDDDDDEEEAPKLSEKEIKRLPKTTIETDDDEIECYYDEDNDKYYYLDTLEEIEFDEEE